MRAFLLAALLCSGCAENPSAAVEVELVGLGGATAGLRGDTFIHHELGATVDLWSLAYRLGKAWAVGAGGAIFHSTDAGQHWVAQTSGTDARLERVAFSDDDNGIAIGELGAILTTHDGGASWIQMPASGKEFPTAAVANGTSWWVGSANGGLFRSSDGAKTFQKQSVPDGVFRAIRFTSDGKIGVAVGDGGVVIRTVDGGETWVSQPKAPEDLAAIDLAPGRAVAVGKHGLVWQSSDAGTTWGAVAVEVTTDLYDVAFAGGANDLWIVGQNGVVLHAAGSGALGAVVNPTATTFTAVARTSP